MHTLHTPDTGPAGVDALPGHRHVLALPDGTRIALVHLPAPPLGVAGLPPATPLLVVHGVSVGASAFEMAPAMLRQAVSRPVVAIDLPGFGASDKPDRRFTPQQMQQAVAAAIGWMRRHVAPVPVDVLALSLGCEFVAAVALREPASVRTLGFISPTGMEARRADEPRQPGASLERGWAHRLLRGTPLGAVLYRLRTRRPVMRWFLARSWGRADVDRRQLAHARRCAALPGARFAPLDCMAGTLVTPGISAVYRALPVPMWVAHGTRGSGTDLAACPQRSGRADGMGPHLVERTAFDTGAMPHVEQPDAFDAAYCRFLHGRELVDALPPCPAPAAHAALS